MRLLITLLISSFWLTYFQVTWETRTTQESNLNEEQLINFLTFSDQATMGAVLIKDGYIVKEQYADGFNQDSYDIVVNSKKFLCSTVGISLDKGEIDSLDDPVSKYVKEYETAGKKDHNTSTNSKYD